MFDHRSSTASVLIPGNLPGVLFLVVLKYVLFLTRRTRGAVGSLVVVIKACVCGNLLLRLPSSAS